MLHRIHQLRRDSINCVPMRNNESGKGTLLIDGEFQLGGAIYKFGNETFPYISEQEYRECNRFMKQSMKRGWRDNGGVPVVDATE